MGGARPELWATEPFFLFDYFRVPYRITEEEEQGGPEAGWGRLGVRRQDGSTAGLRWPVADRMAERMEGPALTRFGDIPVWARRTSDRPQGATDDVVLPFDPREAIESLWRENYRGPRAGASPWPLRAYYALRPLLPRRAQIALRRAYSRLQGRSDFPAWPAETALHDLCARLFELIAELAGTRIPHIAPWPDGHSWAFVLTHDVETAGGQARIPEVCELERSLGYRSCWNLVVGDYEVADSLVAELAAGGFEIGVHGVHHDGREFASLAEFRARLPQVRDQAKKWGAHGYRSPSSLRVWEWLPALGLAYDSSYSDTAPFEPQPGGCCSLLPFFNEDLVELPITMPQDHTMFVILGERDETLWRRKAELISARGGMALMLTHPDYATPDRLAAYGRVLEVYRDDPSAWRALPHEVAAWWRERAASWLEQDGDGWRVAGPAAARGRVAFA